MTDRLAKLTDALLIAARKAGADAADAIAVEGTSLAIDVRGGRLEQAERSEGVDIGLRVLLGARQACVSASDTRAETMAEMAARAVAMAREALEDPHAGLADPAQLARGWDVVALDIDDLAPEPTAAALEEDARRAEAAALAIAGVSQVQSASAGYGRRAIHLAASNGFHGGYARTQRSTSCVAITGNGTGMERDWHAEGRVHQSDLPDAAEIGRLAGERAVARAGARKPPTKAFPIVYDKQITASLIGHLLSAISGTAVAREASWLHNAIGKVMLPTGLSLNKDPLRPQISSSRPFDAKNLPVTRRALVATDVLQS